MAPAWEEAKGATLGMTGLPSLLCNNLTHHGNLVAYCHGEDVVIVDTTTNTRRTLPFKDPPAKIFEVKLCPCSNGAMVLVVAAVDSIQLWLVDPSLKSIRSLLTHSLSEGASAPGAESALFARGIAATQRGAHVVVGCSSGAVLTFGTSEAEFETPFEASVTGHGAPVTAVAGALRGDDVIATADERGEVRLWDVPGLTPRHADRGLLDAGPERPDPCSALALVNHELCCAAFLSGHIRIYQASRNGTGIVAELQAHTRCITGLHVDERARFLATVSEDTYLHVWSLAGKRGGPGGGDEKAEESKDTDELSLACVFSNRCADAVLTGVQFTENLGILVSAYEVNTLFAFSRS